MKPIEPTEPLRGPERQSVPGAYLAIAVTIAMLLFIVGSILKAFSVACVVSLLAVIAAVPSSATSPKTKRHWSAAFWEAARRLVAAWRRRRHHYRDADLLVLGIDGCWPPRQLEDDGAPRVVNIKNVRRGSGIEWRTLMEKAIRGGSASARVRRALTALAEVREGARCACGARATQVIGHRGSIVKRCRRCAGSSAASRRQRLARAEQTF